MFWWEIKFLLAEGFFALSCGTLIDRAASA
jgi:hypothetical protein